VVSAAGYAFEMMPNLFASSSDWFMPTILSHDPSTAAIMAGAGITAEAIFCAGADSLTSTPR
jgi:hypothetical protein